MYCGARHAWLQSEWTSGKEDAAAFCTDQYNRVLTRLKEIDPGIEYFEPLPLAVP
jgi:hypothetical protein